MSLKVPFVLPPLCKLTQTPGSRSNIYKVSNGWGEGLWQHHESVFYQGTSVFPSSIHPLYFSGLSKILSCGVKTQFSREKKKKKQSKLPRVLSMWSQTRHSWFPSNGLSRHMWSMSTRGHSAPLDIQDLIFNYRLVTYTHSAYNAFTFLTSKRKASVWPTPHRLYSLGPSEPLFIT